MSPVEAAALGKSNYDTACREIEANERRFGPAREKLMGNSGLTLAEYQEMARRTARPREDWSEERVLSNFALGLVGESGELVDQIKKRLYHGKEIDRKAMLFELGDVLWYLTMLADAQGFGLEAVAMANIVKLRERYPDGFRVQGGGRVAALCSVCWGTRQVQGTVAPVTCPNCVGSGEADRIGVKR